MAIHHLPSAALAAALTTALLAAPLASPAAAQTPTAREIVQKVTRATRNVARDIAREVTRVTRRTVRRDVAGDAQARAARDLARKVTCEVQAQVARDIRATVTREIRADVVRDIQAKVTREIRADVARDIQAKVTREVKADVARTVTQAASRDVSRSVTREVRDAIRAWSDRYWQDRRGPEQTERLTKAFKVGKGGVLDLATLAGNVTITGGAGEEISVEAVKRVRARTADEAKKQVAGMQVAFTERAGRVEVRTDYTARDIRGAVDFTATVPSGAAVYVKAWSGDLKVSNVRGEIRLENVSGTVVVSGAGQNVRVKSMSGDVQISDVSGDGDVAVNSLSGDQTLKNVKARTLEISGISGDLTLVDVTCERASLHTTSGTVDFTGPLAKSGRYEMRSHSGSIRLTPTSTTGFEVDASTFSGTFRSDFPVTLRAVGPSGASAGPTPPPPPPPPPAPPARTGDKQTGRPVRTAPSPPMRMREFPGRSVQGTYGDGSAVLVLASFSGDITIVKK